MDGLPSARICLNPLTHVLVLHLPLSKTRKPRDHGCDAMCEMTKLLLSRPVFWIVIVFLALGLSLTQGCSRSSRIRAMQLRLSQQSCRSIHPGDQRPPRRHKSRSLARSEPRQRSKKPAFPLRIARAHVAFRNSSHCAVGKPAFHRRCSCPATSSRRLLPLPLRLMGIRLSSGALRQPGMSSPCARKRVRAISS